MCRNWTSPICSVCNITPGIPSTSIKCIQIFPSRWVKVKLGIVYCWSIQVQGPPNSSPEPRVVRLTNVRFIPSQVIYSWRSFESQAALLKTRSSNSKCGTNLFYSGLIGLKSFEHLMGEFFFYSRIRIFTSSLMKINGSIKKIPRHNRIIIDERAFTTSMHFGRLIRIIGPDNEIKLPKSSYYKKNHGELILKNFKNPRRP